MTYQMNDTKWNSIEWFFDRLWENPDNSPDSGVLLVFNDQETEKFLTHRRLTLLSSILKKRKPTGLNDIANEMQASENMILEEIETLAKMALVEKDEKGNWQAKRPIILPEIEMKIRQIAEVEPAL